MHSKPSQYELYFINGNYSSNVIRLPWSVSTLLAAKPIAFIGSMAIQPPENRNLANHQAGLDPDMLIPALRLWP